MDLIALPIDEVNSTISTTLNSNGSVEDFSFSNRVCRLETDNENDFKSDLCDTKANDDRYILS